MASVDFEPLGETFELEVCGGLLANIKNVSYINPLESMHQ